MLTLLAVALFIYLLFLLLDNIPIQAQAKTVIKVVVLVVALIWLAGVLFGFAPAVR